MKLETSCSSNGSRIDEVPIYRPASLCCCHRRCSLPCRCGLFLFCDSGGSLPCNIGRGLLYDGRSDRPCDNGWSLLHEGGWTLSHEGGDKLVHHGGCEEQQTERFSRIS